MAKRDPDNYYRVVQNLFCSFIRDRSREQRQAFAKQPTEPEDNSEKSPPPAIAPDAQTALTTFLDLRTAVSEEFDGETRYNLRGANLRGAFLQGADLAGARYNVSALRTAENVDPKYLPEFEADA